MPAPPTRPRLRERYDARRQGVLDTSARVFAERGYHATSMDNLVEATGLAAGGLYHYIGNKEKLLFSIFEDLLTPLVAEAEAIWAADQDAEFKLRDLMRSWMGHVQHHRFHMIVLQREGQMVSEQPGWEAIAGARDTVKDILDRVLDAVHEQTGKPRNLLVGRMTMLAMLNYAPRWLDPEGPEPVEAIADAHCELLLGRKLRVQRAPAGAGARTSTA